VIDADDELKDADRSTPLETLQRVIQESANSVKVLIPSRDNVHIHALLSLNTIMARVSSIHNGEDVTTELGTLYWIVLKILYNLYTSQKELSRSHLRLYL
jgi:hypothetical protein